MHAIDWTTGEAIEVELPIDPARGAKEQLDRLFKRARRLKEGARIARARLGETQAAQRRLEEALAGLASTDADLDRLEGIARAAAPRDFKPSAAARRTPGARAGRRPVPHIERS